MFVPDRVNVPDPVFVRSDPAPEITPLNVGEFAPMAMVADSESTITMSFASVIPLEKVSVVPSDIVKSPELLPKLFALVTVISPSERVVPPV